MAFVYGTIFTERAAAKRMDSSLITSIIFNPQNQPASFAAGVPNPATHPLRIQSLNAFGTGENVTGDGEAVLITVASSSTTGRFSNSPTGPFNNSAIIVSITSGRQNSQDIYYTDPTPGQVILSATVLLPGNTILFGAETSVTKFVIGGGDRLAFSTQPGNALKDSVIGPPINVRIQDANGNLDTSSSRSVTLSLGNGPSGALLGGTTTVAAVNGIATFTNLHIDQAGTGYTLVASSASPAPALIPVESQPFNIGKLSQTIEFDNIEDRTYGDDDFEIHADASSGSEVSFESLTPDTCSITASLVSIQAAGECTIRASQTGDSNHEPADDVLRTFSINKADAVVIVEPYDVVYNGEAHVATVASITGVKGESDALVGTVDLSGTVHTNAGSFAGDVWAFVGSANYKDATGTVDNNISKASVTAHAGSGSAVYDGTQKDPAPCWISGPGFLGDLKCANDPESVGPNAGTYAVGSTVNGTGLLNFDIAKVDGTFTIEKAPTAISITFENGPYLYRGSPFTASAKATGPNGLEQSVPVSYTGDCVNASVAGGCVASGDFGESTNYLGSSGSSSITIGKRSVSVAASSHAVTFGAAVPEITPSIDGLVAGESVSVIDSLPTCSTTYTAGSPVGSYATNCAAGHDNNYSFSQPYASGTIVVNSACSAFNGFLSPVGGANALPNMTGPGGSFNSPLRTFKLNSTIPFKFTAICLGSPLTSGIQSLRAQKYSNGVPVDDEVLALDDDDSTPDHMFRYSDGQWHFNFKTKELGDAGHGTWLFEVRLFDGSRYGVWLAIKK